jgi:hypothetical protein
MKYNILDYSHTLPHIQNQEKFASYGTIIYVQRDYLAFNTETVLL